MEIIVRATIIFIVLFFVVKIQGQKQIKNLTLYDYIQSITIGSIAADTIISTETPLIDGLIALLFFGLIGYITSLISYKNHQIKNLMDGNPIILYENNNFNYKNLASTKLSVAKVLEACRLKNCFDINELDSAILEPSGDISILLKEINQPLTSSDLKTNIKTNTPKQSFNHLIIIDGCLNKEELKKAHKDYNWLKNYLNEKEKNIAEISLLSIDKNNKITLFSKK